jgi:hypothetical protein
MNVLRQSTAAQTRSIGSFVDDTDFKTVENGLTIANTDIKLKKNGATAVNKNSGGGTSDVNGFYAVTFDATDTNTVGELEVSVDVAGALVVWKTFFVIEESVYDLYYVAAASGEVVLQGVTHTGAVIPTVSVNTDMRGTDSALLAASAPTNFGDMSITVTTGLVDVTQTAADKAWSTTTRILTASTNFNDIAATDIVSNGAITTLTGSVASVDLCDLTTLTTTTTTNTDMITFANIWTGQFTESYAAVNVVPTPAQSMLWMQQRLTERAVVSTTETIKEIDGTTTAGTITLDSATAPTSNTRAT